MFWRCSLFKMVKSSLSSSYCGSSNGLKSKMSKTYEEAVRTLNSLQSNAETLEKARAAGKNHTKNVANMKRFIQRSGLTLDEVDKLSIIHISGTKGKGSTAAFCESILRHQGYKTAFFSSPHLVEVRERFRINGKPISKELFSSKFWHVYNKLSESKASHDDLMPAYFAFLTVLSCHIFLEQSVDVTILEVGIGGEYDSTNFVQNPVVCGVTSLGLDHTTLLGTSIESIAWNKAGIFKPGIPAVTVEQPPEALKILYQRSLEKENPLYVTSCLPPSDDVTLGIHGEKQILNASLALQLCRIWTQSRTKDSSVELDKVKSKEEMCGIPVLYTPTLSLQHKQGLSECQWYGRNQTVHRPGLTYYLDGAHTADSMKQCVKWFKQTSLKEAQSVSGKVIKLLLFNITGDRDVLPLLHMLKQCDFNAALFMPNLAFSTADPKHSDNDNKTVTDESKLRRSRLNMKMWDSLHNSSHGNQNQHNNCDSNKINSSHYENSVSLENGVSENSALSNGVDSKQILSSNKFQCNSYLFPCISSALFWATQGKDSCVFVEGENIPTYEVPAFWRHATHIQILVTGSLHLVGGTLGIVTPNLND